MTEDVRGAEPARPFIIGLTGPIASGKSTVAQMLLEHGADIIDADQVYHSLIKPRSPLLKSIVDRFGPSILDEDGVLNRSMLGSIVFNDSAALADLESMTHPAVVSAVRRRIAQSTAPLVVIEAVKLVQSGLTADIDSLWLVTADQATRIHRLMLRNDLSQDEARQRMIASGDPLPNGVRPDVIIDASCSLASTRDAVDAAWRILLESQLGSCRTNA